MDLPRDNVLAGAALAGEQNSRVAGGGLAGSFEQVLHRGAARVEQRLLVDRAAQRAIFRLKDPDVQRAIDGVLNLFERERLGDIVVGAGLHRLHGIFNGRISGHQNYQALGRAPLDLAQQFQPGHLGHPVVGQHQVELRLGEDCHGLRAVLGLANLVAKRLEKRHETSPDIALVIDDKQLGHQVSRAAGISTMNREP